MPTSDPKPAPTPAPKPEPDEDAPEAPEVLTTNETSGQFPAEEVQKEQ